MSTEEKNALGLGLGVLAAGVCGLAAWWALNTLATPPDFAVRRSALTQRVAQLERLSKLPAETAAFGPRALCAGSDAASLDAVRGEIQATTGAAGAVKLTYVALQPAPRANDGARLTPVALNLRAEGSYDALSAFVDRLAGLQPVIFVDRLDLQAAKPDVVLKLTGKVFCWTSA